MIPKQWSFCYKLYEQEKGITCTLCEFTVVIHGLVSIFDDIYSTGLFYIDGVNVVMKNFNYQYLLGYCTSSLHPTKLLGV